MPLPPAFICDDARVQQHRLHEAVDALREDVHEIAVGAGQQPRRHLDDGDGAAERRVDRAEFEADVAAADDEQRLRNVRQVERAGRIHHARVVHLEHRRNRRRRPGREDACSNVSVSSSVHASCNRQRVRVDDLGEALDVLAPCGP